MRRISLVVVLVAALLVGAAPAGAGPVGCGTTIFASTTLTQDLICAGDGIVIGAPGVVLDLGGHTVAGPGSSFTAHEIAVSVEAPQATVRNGRIAAFRYGVHLGAGTDGSLVERVSFDRAGDAVHVLSSSNRIRHNSVTRGNSVAVWIGGDSNVVESNSFQDTVAGVFMSGLDNLITGNDIVGEHGDDRGILAFRGGRIVGNRVSNYGGAAGIESFHGGFVSGNYVFGNVDGIRAQGPASVVGNIVFSNSDDGIEVGPGVLLQANTAVRNGGLGINAAGALDAGGNQAFGNGNELQCVGVACG